MAYHVLQMPDERQVRLQVRKACHELHARLHPSSGGGGGIHNLPIIGRLFRRRACNFQRCVKCAHLVMKGDGRIIAFYKTDGTYMVEYKDADGDVYRETIDCRKHKIQK